MARYTFVEEFPAANAAVVQHWRSGKTTVQEFDLPGALSYAQSHGKRQDLSDHVERTSVVFNGQTVYSVVPFEISSD